MTRIYQRFKGTVNEYRALHDWVQRKLGTPQECENCGTKEAKRYEWANISDLYLKDVSDWARLCVKCHRFIDGNGFDYKDVCVRGHVLSGSNVRYKTVKGRTWRFCVDCQRLYQREAMVKIRQAKKLSENATK